MVNKDNASKINMVEDMREREIKIEECNIRLTK